MGIIGLGYLGFETTKLDEWRVYGPEVMGFQIGRTPESDPESLYFKTDDRRNRFAFHPGKIDRLNYIGWEARGRLEFIAAVAKCRAAGVELTVGDAALCETRGVKELIRFRDPVGYRHELFYGQKWTPQSFVAGRRHGGFVADHRGHGPGRMGVQHVGLFVKSVRDVGETHDIVKQRKLPMMMELGQHTQDPHMSFYHFNASGFAFETIVELEPWHPDGFELNPEKMSTWGHEVVGPILGPSVKTPEEVLDPEVLAALRR